MNTWGGQQDLDRTLRTMPAEPDTVRATCAHLGETLGATAVQAGLPRETIVNAFTEGLDRGLAPPAGARR